MISERSALMRQVQHFFHHPAIIGLYGIDDAKALPAVPAPREAGKPREAGRFLDKIELRFGPFDLEVIGPFEDAAHPCGRAKLQCGGLSIDGPLDATTWDRLAKFVKENSREENQHGRSSACGSDTGRGGGGVIPGWGS